MAENATAFREGNHPGYEETAWKGLEMSLDVLAERGIKVVINGGSLNPAGLARQVQELAAQKNLPLRVAYVSGDDLMSALGPDLASLKDKLPPHLDSVNTDIKIHTPVLSFKSWASVPLVSANAYLGARAIVQGLRHGADIIICGRVADASPVIGAAWYWHGWTDTDYDRLAGSLIAGHLIECSAYVTGGNFAGFTEYAPQVFVEPGFPVRVSGIRGAPPPPTTKVAIFYQGGFQSQILVNSTGYGTAQKYALLETQLRKKLKESKIDQMIDLLEFQIVGIPEANPRSQLASTTYCRIFAEAKTAESLMGLLLSFSDISLQHFSGFHAALDMRTAIPKPFLAMYPALYPQDSLHESVTFLDGTGTLQRHTMDAGHPPVYERLEQRENYDTASPTPLETFGPTQRLRLGTVALARSGDKGSNLNVGFFVQTPRAFAWLRTFLSSARMKQLMGEDWIEEEYFLERVEFPGILAVHFVVYGILGRGVSSSSRLDALGKAFADFVRDRVVDVPVCLVKGQEKL
ncbi:hypothetical protein BP6252_11455 [Coleophoma cylindrospora]|uniref:DUF1446-domain-containing protein n=1 Tax=Coleophoma cylindrospora TaxID=1849047 RepID=A0A3D8QJN1_9HELO|nr:hypothetical protein BP6252_11455 [Coleophoma cylindrospora]